MKEIKLLVITDFDSTGSGYKTICAPLFTELHKMGGYETKIIGLMYRGEEHNYPFSVLPARDMQEVNGIATNLMYLWNPDVVIAAMDIPIQINIYNQLAQFQKKYVAITPLENGPLTMSWAIPLFNMDAVFFISELGKQEALKVGLKAEHLQIGVDTASFHPGTPEEKSKLRDGLGISQDAFVVLTVADNQERKNLWAGLKAISLLKKEVDKPIRYILVTREQNPYGWKLRDLIKDLDIQQEVMIFERGLPQRDLWGLYVASDAYLQPSKAEGLGLPVLDAMACGIPCVATDTGALRELLQDNRGYLVSGYVFDNDPFFVDVWGNSHRVMINIQEAASDLETLAKFDTDFHQNALKYVRSRTWDIPAIQLDNKLREILNESQEQK